MKTWLVCYDIEDDKKRNQVAKTLEGYGQRVQYSVFELHLADDRLLEDLKRELREIVGKGSPDILFYRLTLEGARDSLRLNGEPIGRPLVAVVI